MTTKAEFHSHQYFNGRGYTLRAVHSDGGLAWNPKTYYEIWDQYGQNKLHEQWFRSVGAANKKAHEIITLASA